MKLCSLEQPLRSATKTIGLDPRSTFFMEVELVELRHLAWWFESGVDLSKHPHST